MMGKGALPRESYPFLEGEREGERDIDREREGDIGEGGDKLRGCVALYSAS